MTAATTRAEDPSRPADGADAWMTPQGLVTIAAPAGALPYYRLYWYTADGARKQTTGGRTFTLAWRKALTKETDLVAGATVNSEKPCSVGIDYWLDPTRPTAKGGWGKSMRNSMTYYADRYFRPTFGQVRHMDLRRSHIQACVNAAPTASEGKNVRRAAANLIKAMRQGEYMLDTQVIDLASVWWHGQQAPKDAESDEEARGFVEEWERPSANQVRALREAAAAVGRGIWWRGLMVELAAFAGPRWGELIALDDAKFHATERSIVITDQVLFETGKKPRLAPPKMAKRRTTIYPEVSPTGYELELMVRKRLAEVAAEKKAGTNPRGLLFPSRTGEWLQSGNFHRDIFEPAALKAGWTYKDGKRANGVDKAGKVLWRDQRSWDLVWHSLRHTFCTTALEEWGLADTVVAVLAGHKNSATTRRLYVGAAEDARDQALRATGRTAP